MATDDADEAQHALQKLRDDICRLQSERARKQELVQRTRNKCRALNDEVKTRGEEVARMSNLLEYESRHAENAAAMEGVGENKLASINERLRKNVVDLLATRLSSEQEMQVEDDCGDGAAEEKKPELVHNTVWVTYVIPNAAMNYHVSFRVCPTTMLSNFFQDCCDYWGCMHTEHYLLKDRPALPPINFQLATVDITAEVLTQIEDLRDALCPLDQEDRTDTGAVAFLMRQITLYPRGADDKDYAVVLRRGYVLLQRGCMAGYDDFDVLVLSNTLVPGSEPLFFQADTEGTKLSTCLPISEAAHLFLVPQSHVDVFLAELAKNKLPTKKTTAENEDTTEEVQKQMLVTAKAVHYESMLDVLKPWPGVFHVFTAQDIKDLHLLHICARDIFFYSVFLALTVTIFVLYEQEASFWLYDGVRPLFGDVSTIRRQSEMWSWFKNTLSPMLFDASSNMRTFYSPGGFLRIRQQRATTRVCPRKEMVENEFEPILNDVRCYKVGVEQLDTRTLTITHAAWNDPTTGFDITMMPMGGGISSATSYKSAATSASTLGQVRSYADGGYFVAYDISDSNLASKRAKFDTSIDLLPYWVDSSTRLIMAEFNLYSTSYERWISCSVLFEFPATSALVASVQVRPFAFLSDPTENISAAMSIDYARLAIIIYILLINVPAEIRFMRNVRKKPGWWYPLSLNGFLDAVLVTIFILCFSFRVGGQLDRPSLAQDASDFRIYALTYQSLFKLESILMLVTTFRLVSFFRISQHVFEYWQILSVTLVEYIRFSVVFVTILLGFITLAYTIWSPYHAEFRSFSESIFHILIFLRGELPLRGLLRTHEWWTIIFMSLFFAIIIFFFLNGFVAISCYVYWSQMLLHQKAKTDNAAFYKMQSLATATRREWAQWLLWEFVFDFITGAKKQSKVSGDDD
eukprot:GEMP01009973.1.p1 GENE.GEMP01009973.1~~GEMP01009973.1.p1  ORF type:complete len:917 (+),score=186.38 GEMP01009973.1:90-2840(+)